MASNSETIRRRIEAGKSTVRDKYAVAKVAARRLAQAYTALSDAEEMRDLKNTPKSKTRCAVAENTLLSAKKEFISFVSLYTSFVGDVLSLYDELIAEENARGAKRARAEAERFETRESYLKDALYDMVKDVEGISEMTFDSRSSRYSKPMEDAEDVKAYNETQNETRQSAYQKEEYQNPPQYRRREYYQPYHDVYRPHPQPVHIAPTTIDISGIVEDAVSTAMEKFKAVFNRRVDEFLTENPLPGCGAAASGAVLETEAEIAENEAEIVEKLKTVIENLSSVSKSMTELGASYMALSNAERDAVEAQRKINDMQRTLTREIQGVQANQKVITAEQADVTAEQARVIAEGKANIENQKLLAEEQEKAKEMQKELFEAQSALDASIREIIASQKAIISNQQSIIAANKKNIELQRELEERQSELHTAQKAIMSEHKQLVRKMKPKTE